MFCSCLVVCTCQGKQKMYMWRYIKRGKKKFNKTAFITLAHCGWLEDESGNGVTLWPVLCKTREEETYFEENTLNGWNYDHKDRLKVLIVFLTWTANESHVWFSWKKKKMPWRKDCQQFTTHQGCSIRVFGVHQFVIVGSRIGKLLIKMFLYFKSNNKNILYVFSCLDVPINCSRTLNT